MSLPRQIIPGATVLLTRRTSQRQFLLRPDPVINQVFEYCLGYAARKYNIQVHAWCAMSNHYHLVVTDPNGNIPAFMSWFNEFIAKSLNAYYGRWENFFAPGSYSMVRLEGPEDILDKMVYTLVNPVRAGLVASSEQWPGSTSRRLKFQSPVVVARPGNFFRSKGPMPSEVELSTVRPHGFEGETDEEFEKRLLERIEKREKELQEEISSQRRSFLGTEKVLRIRPTSAPRTSAPRRNMNPRVAARDKEDRMAALGGMAEFWAEYRRCWRRWREGDRGVVFPYGTYHMRLYAAVATAPPA